MAEQTNTQATTRVAARRNDPRSDVEAAKPDSETATMGSIAGEPGAVATVSDHARAVARRNDPVRRSLDGVDNELVGADPELKYVLVGNNAADGMGIPFYEELGYVVVRAGENSPHLRGTKRPPTGEVVTFRGHTLMCIELAEAERIKREGAPMAGHGTNHWDRLQKGILAKRFSRDFDPIAGVGGRQYMDVINETSISSEMVR